MSLCLPKPFIRLRWIIGGVFQYTPAKVSGILHSTPKVKMVGGLYEFNIDVI